MRNRINVLVHGMTDHIGGMENFFMNYYRSMKETNVHFDFLCTFPDMAYAEEVKKRGDNVYCITDMLANPLKYWVEVSSFFRTHCDYDVVYVMSLDLVNIDFIKRCKRANIPVRIVHSHNSSLTRDSKLKEQISLYCHNFHKAKIDRYANVYWACSKAAAQWMFSKELQEKVEIIHNAVSLEEYGFDLKRRERVRSAMGIGDGITIYGQVGRLDRQKNPFFLVDIYTELIKKNPNGICWLIGDGPYREELERIISERGLEHNILLLGKRNDVADLMQAMDIFVFPSLYEGLSLVMVEAQAAGLQIFASNALSVEHKLTDLVEFIDASWSAEQWADYIICNSKISDRCKTDQMIRWAGYDIETEKERIMRYVLSAKSNTCEV